VGKEGKIKKERGGEKKEGRGKGRAVQHGGRLLPGDDGDERLWIYVIRDLF